MTTVIRQFPTPKSKMSVQPTNWLPGSLSAALPFYAMDNSKYPNRLFFRADDPNIYGIASGGLMQTPTITKNNIQKSANKGCNFYSAPWCIQLFSSRDNGQRYEIKELDNSIYQYITALYGLVGSSTPITLTNWQLEQTGYVKQYQVLQGSAYVNVNGSTYFGATTTTPSVISGVGSLTPVDSPLITNDFVFNGIPIPTYQMVYNTFYAIDTPIVISAIDTNNLQGGRIYFTLGNTVTMQNTPTN